MKFLYVPKSGIRRVGQIVWNAENEYVAEVKDVDLAATLVTYPTDQFELVEIKPAERKKLEKALGAELGQETGSSEEEEAEEQSEAES